MDDDGRIAPNESTLRVHFLRADVRATVRVETGGCGVRTCGMARTICMIPTVYVAIIDCHQRQWPQSPAAWPGPGRRSGAGSSSAGRAEGAHTGSCQQRNNSGNTLPPMTASCATTAGTHCHP